MSEREQSIGIEMQKSAARIKMRIDHVIQNTTFWKTWLGGSLGAHLALTIIQFILTQTQDDLKPVTPYFTYNYRIVMLGLNFVIPYAVLLLTLLFTNLSGSIGFVLATGATVSSAVACGMMAIAQLALVFVTLITFFSCGTTPSSGPCPTRYAPYWVEFGVEAAQVLTLIAATVSLSFLEAAFAKLNSHLVRRVLGKASKKIEDARNVAAAALAKARNSKKMPAQVQQEDVALIQNASASNPRAIIVKQARKHGVYLTESEVAQHGPELLVRRVGVDPAKLREDNEMAATMHNLSESINSSGNRVVDASQLDFVDVNANARKRRT